MKSAPLILFSMILAFALPACAVQQHHPAAANAAVVAEPAKDTAAPVVEANMGKMDQAIQQMQQTRMKMQMATNPAEKKRLLHMHMQQMQDGMKMMGTMGMMSGQQMGKMPMGGQGMGKMAKDNSGMGNMPMKSQDMSAMPANDRMQMMEKKMAMMEEMMGPGGMMNTMMGPEGMMGHMLMMEKKMAMMMEMMNGMMAQQGMMMK